MFNWLTTGWSRRSVTLMFLLTFLGLGACSVGPPKGIAVVAPFDLERYLGTWYEIARLDHSFERNLDNVRADYSVRPDGDVEVLNSGYDLESGKRKEAVGVAKFTGARDVGSLRVSFFGPFYGGYHLVALDENYRWAMVVGQDRDYFWILARDRQLPEAVRNRLVAQAAELGVDVTQLILVDQGRALAD